MASDASDKTTNYRINLVSNAKSASIEASSAMLDLYGSITKSKAAIQQLSEANRLLIGTDREIVDAKADLKAKIEEERVALAKANLELINQGVTYGKLASQAKNAGDATGDAIKKIGGPVDALRGQFDSLKTVFAGATTATGALTIGAVALAAAFVAVAAGIVAATTAAARWIIESASLAKTQELSREAFAGSAENARHLGEQVADLGSKVATPTEELNQLGIQLIRTRLSGPAVVDSLNAIGQASAAAGKDVGNAVQEWITRGQMWNRFSLHPLEMQGTGIMFTDVAKQLATNLGVGLDKAQMALRQGSVRIEDGAKALRDVVEKNFGAINVQRMATLDNLTETFHKHLRTLTADVDFGRLIAPLEQVMQLFDASSVSGNALKQLVDELFGSIASTFEGGVPVIQDFVEKFTIGALELHTQALNIATSFVLAFGNVDPLYAFEKGLKVVEAAAVLAGVSLGVAAVSAGLLSSPVVTGFLALLAIYDAIKIGYQLVKGIDWQFLGQSIMDGFVKGFHLDTLVNMVTGAAGAIKDAFRNALGIHSPSAVFAEYGAQTTAGYAQGIDKTADQATDAVEQMAPVPSPGGGQAHGGMNVGGNTIHLGGIHVHVEGGGDGSQIADRMAAPVFRSMLVQVLEEAFLSSGVPTQTTVTP